MQGLLGTSIDDPRTLGLLQMAAALSSGRKFMPALAQGLLARQQVVQGAAEAEEAKKDRAMRRGLLDMQIKEQQQQAERRQGIDAAYRNAFRTPEQMAMGANGGPTLAAAQAAPGMAPGFDQNALLRGLAQADPQAAFGMMQPKPADMVALSPGQVLYNKSAGKEVFRAPEKPEELPGAVREFMFAQKNPAFDQWNRSNKQAGATRVAVDAGQRFENEYSKAQGKAFSEFKEKISAAGFSAPTQLRKLERMEQLLQGVDGGKLSPTGLEVASALNSLGIKVDPRLGNKEAAESLSRELAGSLRQPGTGPSTDKDFDNFLLQVPSLSKTAEGRAQIIKTQRAALNRDIAIAKLAREYQKRNGTLDDGFMEEAAQFIAENPVVQAPAGWVVAR